MHNPGMRLLVSTCPAVGHLLPLLPLARAARARGHDVRIAAGASILPIVARSGFPALPVGPASLEPARRDPSMAGLVGRRRAVQMTRTGFAGSIARGISDDLLAALATTGWRPDVIVHEDMEIGSWIVAERLGIAHATVQITAWRPRFRRLIETAVEPLRREHGLAEDASSRLLGSVFFTTRPPSMRDPAAPLPDVTAELRPIADDLDAGPPDASQPDLAGDDDPFSGLAGEGEGPRVAVTLGTIFADRGEVLRTLIDGAAAAGGPVVVGLGSEPAAFGAVAPNVALHAYVPMSTLLPRADVVAFHGGAGTMLAAAAAGRPMLITPLGADQPDNADDILRAGAGRILDPAALTVDAVRAAILAVHGDPEFAHRAGQLATELVAMPGPDAAVRRLENVAVGSR
jgi:UDP:flavonoid glycosyltransferase YjiC (YdhE family)